MQSSCLPVVYKMLTAEDKGAQQAAVKMLTCLCQVDAQWQQQEQLAIAMFGNGAILLSLVERVQSACHQRKLSATRASELSSVLNLVSLITGGECCMQMLDQVVVKLRVMSGCAACSSHRILGVTCCFSNYPYLGRCCPSWHTSYMTSRM